MYIYIYIVSVTFTITLKINILERNISILTYIIHYKYILTNYHKIEIRNIEKNKYPSARINYTNLQDSV